MRDAFASNRATSLAVRNEAGIHCLGILVVTISTHLTVAQSALLFTVSYNLGHFYQTAQITKCLQVIITLLATQIFGTFFKFYFESNVYVISDTQKHC